MSESTFPQESPQASAWNNASPEEETPQFGAVDIVEAFTAMRHEWRGQTKESRALAEQIQTAAQNLQALAAGLQALESNVLASVAEQRPESSAETKPLAMILIETDHQLSRAAAAIAQWEASRKLREAADAQAVEHCFAALNPLARWFARPLRALIAEQHSLTHSAGEHPAITGLNMVLARLRRAMLDQGLERIDVLGQPFDAETMHAIGAVESADCPSGHVAEQFSPAYRWQGKLLRYADVRTAK